MFRKQTIYRVFDILVLCIFVVCMMGRWVTEDWWIKFIKPAPVLITLALMILFFNHINLWKHLIEKDKELYLIIFGGILAIVNLILVDSRPGAIFTISSLLIIVYLPGKVKFSRFCILLISVSCLLMAIFWLVIVRPDFRYSPLNTNMTAIIIFNTVVTSYLGMHGLFYKDVYNKYWKLALGVILIILLYKAFQLRARGLALGIIALGGIYFIFPLKKMAVYVILGFTLVFPLVYNILWRLNINYISPLWGKQLMSGRAEIWNSFLEIFLKHPLTGIGSNFEQMVPNVSAPSIHNALLDILIVHGIIVFMIFLFLFVKRLNGLTLVRDRNDTQWLALSIVLSMIIIGTFENYYITSPENFLLFIILSWGYQFKNVSYAYDNGEKS